MPFPSSLPLSVHYTHYCCLNSLIYFYTSPPMCFWHLVSNNLLKWVSPSLLNAHLVSYRAWMTQSRKVQGESLCSTLLEDQKMELWWQVWRVSNSSLYRHCLFCFLCGHRQLKGLSGKRAEPAQLTFCVFIKPAQWSIGTHENRLRASAASHYKIYSDILSQTSETPNTLHPG